MYCLPTAFLCFPNMVLLDYESFMFSTQRRGKKTEFRNIIKGIAKGLKALMIIFSTSIWQLTFNGYKRYENLWLHFFFFVCLFPLFIMHFCIQRTRFHFWVIIIIADFVAGVELWTYDINYWKQILVMWR